MMSMPSAHIELGEGPCCEVDDVFGDCYGECGCEDCKLPEPAEPVSA